MDNDFDYNWEEWQRLNQDEKRYIFNHYWNMFNSDIGYKTKVEIVNNFIESIDTKAKQYGIASFGWGVYMLYVVVDSPKQRVNKEFAGLPINKGVIIEQLENKNFKVKFSYGGAASVDLSQKIIIR